MLKPRTDLLRLLLLTTLTMVAFAGNSLLCRQALESTEIDPASFTTVRLVSGALMLWLIVRIRHGQYRGEGNWLSALALFSYAAGFSFAYVSLPAAVGALLLFGAVQATMIGYGLLAGEQLRGIRLLGVVLALGGMIGLLMPGLSAPPLMGALLMLGAGVAWGIYSIRGAGAGNALRKTTGNFVRSVPVTLLLSILLAGDAQWDSAGLWYAVASGALASGLGYAVWYTVLPALKSTTAATVQLSVPVIAAAGGIVFLGEPLTARLLLTSAAILGGIALVVTYRHQAVK